MTVERGSALVLRGDDPLDRRQIALAKRIVLLARDFFASFAAEQDRPNCPLRAC